MQHNRFDLDSREYQEVYREARWRTRDKLGFFVHLALAAISIPVIISLSSYSAWAVFIALAWAVGLLFHYAAAFRYQIGYAQAGPTRNRKSVVDRMIEREIEAILHNSAQGSAETYDWPAPRQ